jgi:hypothetical protein
MARRAVERSRRTASSAQRRDSVSDHRSALPICRPRGSLDEIAPFRADQ